MMKKILTILAFAVVAVSLQSMASTAYGAGQGGYGPHKSYKDPSVRAGGLHTDMSNYFTNLRGGVVRHPRQDYNMRMQLSADAYPRESQAYQGYTRIGGRYNYGYGGIGGTLGSKRDYFTFNGGYRHGSSTYFS